MALGIDIRGAARLCLVLVLLSVAVGPVCSLMSPSMAMAGGAPMSSCGSPIAPESGSDCPRVVMDNTLKAADNSVKDYAVILPVAVFDAAIYLQPVQSSPAGEVIPERPPAHLPPLRV